MTEVSVETCLVNLRVLSFSLKFLNCFQRPEVSWRSFEMNSQVVFLFIQCERLVLLEVFAQRFSGMLSFPKENLKLPNRKVDTT